MGIICCKNDSKYDLMTEIKKGSVEGLSSTLHRQSKLYSETTTAEQIILKQQENPLKDYSLLLFQELNNFRLQPHKYYVGSIQYDLTYILKELIKNKNDENNKKDLELKWSSKNEIIIYNIMQDKTKDINSKLKSIIKRFDSIFDLIILYIIGNYNNIKESIWKVLLSFKKLDEKKFNTIILNKIDYCVIYSIQYEEEISKKLNRKFKRNSDLETDIYNIENIEESTNNYDTNINNDIGDQIISFYFLFICNEENSQNYNFENTNVVNW